MKATYAMGRAHLRQQLGLIHCLRNMGKSNHAVLALTVSHGVLSPWHWPCLS